MEKDSGLLNTTDPNTSDTIDAFIANGMKLVHNAAVSDRAINKISKSNEPVKDIAEFTVSIIERLEEGGKAKGLSLPLESLAQVANILMGDIIHSAELAGLEKLTDDEKYMAYSLAVSTYIDSGIKSGKLTNEQMQKLSDQAQNTPEGQKIVADVKDAGQQAIGRT